jgi:hypothetical protein
MVEQYLHFPMCLHGIVFTYFIFTFTTSQKIVLFINAAMKTSALEIIKFRTKLYSIHTTHLTEQLPLKRKGITNYEQLATVHN